MPFEKRGIKEVYGGPWRELDKELFTVVGGKRIARGIPNSL